MSGEAYLGLCNNGSQLPYKAETEIVIDDAVAKVVSNHGSQPPYKTETMYSRKCRQAP